MQIEGANVEGRLMVILDRRIDLMMELIVLGWTAVIRRVNIGAVVLMKEKRRGERRRRMLFVAVVVVVVGIV